MIKYNNSNNTNTPTFWDYKWAHNYLISNEVPLEKGLEILNIIFNKMKICAKRNDAWNIKWPEDERKEFLEMSKAGKEF